MNRFVIALLKSPLHGLLSRKVQVIRYRGRRSGASFTTPTQYLEVDDTVIMVVGRPETKTWWRNFVEPWPVDLLIRRKWRRMMGNAIWRHEDAEFVDAARAAFLAKYGARGLGEPEADLLIVSCRPRTGDDE